MALLLALITLVVYLPATRCDFIFLDDDDYVTNNPMVTDGVTWPGIKQAFTGYYAGNWHPVTWLSHMLDCQLFGLEAGAHHFVSTLLHSANAALLFVLLWRLTGKLWPAALVAAFFAWHPLRVESVAWVAERKDVLSTFFALLALIVYVRFVREKSRRAYWLAVACFATALMAKPMVVTLPFLLLLLDWWPLQRFTLKSFRWSLVSEKIPFFALSFVSCIITCQAQKSAMSTLSGVPPAFRVENAIEAVVRYLSAIFWPAKLAVVYPLQSSAPGTLALAGGLIVLISIAVWWMGRRHGCWPVGWLWFLGTLVPVIGIIQVGMASHADRYTYIPSIGITIAVVFGLYELIHKQGRLRKAFGTISILLLAGCILLTEHQLRYWRDGETLFRHALAVTANNCLAHLSLGVALERQARYAEAEPEFTEASRLYPVSFKFQFFIGNMYLKMNRPADALEKYQLCLQRAPNAEVLHGMAAEACARQGKFDAARAEISRAEALDAHYGFPHIVAAKILLAQGQASNAVAELWTAVRVEPYNTEVLSTVARYLAAHPDAAVRDGQHALVFAFKANDLAHQNNADIADVLGMALAETGDFTNAMISAQNALNLGRAARRVDLGDFETRLELYQKNQPWRESFALTNPAAKTKN